ncbi:hypothetical protein HYS93_01235 [Candidatus Daviesbacteria bacterium]|nr:hypothetical protein [Candidatus Daviesbacteria bacterium]
MYFNRLKFIILTGVLALFTITGYPQAASLLYNLSHIRIVFAQSGEIIDDDFAPDDPDIFLFDSNDSGGGTCGWQVVFEGCDRRGNSYQVRKNSCTGEIQPYFNPHRDSDRCDRGNPNDPTLCSRDSSYTIFRGCAEECGVAFYACEDDPFMVRKYSEPGSGCDLEENNDACIQSPEPSPSPEESPSPSASASESGSPSPSGSGLESPSPNPQPSSDFSPLPRITKISSFISGEEVDLSKTNIKDGTEIVFKADVESESKNYYCLWNFENVIDESNQLLEIKQPCIITMAFKKDALNQGSIKVSVRAVDIFKDQGSDKREVRGSDKSSIFQVSSLPVNSVCSDSGDNQTLKECIVKQAGSDKEPLQNKELAPLMLCLYDLEGKEAYTKLNPNAKTVFDQVLLVKQTLLNKGMDWESYQLCIRR